MRTANEVWLEALQAVLEDGAMASPTSPGADWRGNDSRELIAFKTIWPMSSPIITIPDRKLGYRFMCAEAAWILSGDNRLSSITPFAKGIKDFSDDGYRFFGAYGPQFVSQVSGVIAKLAQDKATRQAVIDIWRPNPPETRDTPCTLSWQFLIRDHTLHCIATMRSSDLWTGVPYDVFNFSMVAASIALELRRLHGITVKLGELHLTAGSQHLYERDCDAVEEIVGFDDSAPVVPDLDLSKFESHEDLTTYLWEGAKDSTYLMSGFIRKTREPA